MRQVMRFGFATAVGLALGGAAAAQTTGTGGGASTPSGSGGLAGSSAPTGSGISFNNSLSATPVISSPGSATGQAAATGVNPSNVFGQYYANPYYQGRAGSTTSTAPGGFGQALYGTGGASGSPGTQTVNTGVANRTSFGGTTGAGGATTGFGGQTANRSGAGGTTGFGNAGGFGSAASSAATLGGQVIQLPRQIAYTATIRFATPPMTPARVLADARTVLDRSTMLFNPRGVEVLTDGQVVVLRGAVKDEDEARLAENMLRLTPGVRDVRNELRYAPSQP